MRHRGTKQPEPDFCSIRPAFFVVAVLPLQIPSVRAFCWRSLSGLSDRPQKITFADMLDMGVLGGASH
jgi:hypothetical protein